MAKASSLLLSEKDTKIAKLQKDVDDYSIEASKWHEEKDKHA